MADNRALSADRRPALGIITGPTDHGPTVVTLRGELDLAASDHLCDILLRLVATSPAGIALDLSELTFCDSTGLSTFVQVDQKLQAAHHQCLHLRGPTSQVQRVLAITSFDDMLCID
jgi:anti-anti-sigma factor